MHTNQVELGRRNAGLVMAGAAYLLTYMLCGMHCHKAILLHPFLTTSSLAKMTLGRG